MEIQKPYPQNSGRYPIFERREPRILEFIKHRELWHTSSGQEKAEIVSKLIDTCFRKRLINELIYSESEKTIFSLIINQITARYVKDHQSQLNPLKGLILSGSVGVGKTTFLESVAEAVQYIENVLLPTHFEYSEEGYSKALREKNSVIIKEAQREFTQKQTMELPRELIYTSMLFDEFGDSGDDIVRYMGNSINFIIDILYKRHQLYIKALQDGVLPKLTLITSNLSKEEIIERYNLKNADRLFQMCEIIEWKGDSKRK